MNEFMENWKNQTKKERVISCAIIILTVTVIAFAILQSIGIWDNALSVAEILMGIALLLQTITYWNSDRKLAYLNMGAAAFLLLVAAIALIL